MLLTITSDTWIVTGLGFGIVLVLLFCLVFILQGFGWIMQKATATPQKAKGKWQMANESPITNHQSPITDSRESDDAVAVAYALYLASRDGKHDQPTAMISLNQRDTAWNTKSIGLN